VSCDVTPWRPRHKGIDPTERGSARGGPPRSGSDFTRINLFNCCFSFFLLSCRFASPKRHRGGGMVGDLILYYAGSRKIAAERNIRRRREWRARGNAAAGPEWKSPHHQQIRRSDTERKVAVPKGSDRKRTPPRAQADGWSQGQQRTLRRMFAPAWPAGRILPL